MDREFVITAKAIAEIQGRFHAAGYQWRECVFTSDPNCMIEFTKDKSPHALDTYPRPKDCVGWGRFDRWYAWYQAGEWLKRQQAMEEAKLTPV